MTLPEYFVHDRKLQERIDRLTQLIQQTVDEDTASVTKDRQEELRELVTAATNEINRIHSERQRLNQEYGCPRPE
jgi:hypothetical protein